MGTGGEAVHATLDDVVRTVEQARTMPMSASAVVHRPELLALLEQLRTQLAQALGAAEEVLGARDDVVEQGRQEAARLVQEGLRERDLLVSRTEVHREAAAEAARLVAEAEATAATMRVQVDDYVDGKLATFEVVLHRTLEAVERGRAKLAGRSALDALAGGEQDEPLPQ